LLPLLLTTIIPEPSERLIGNLPWVKDMGLTYLDQSLQQSHHYHGGINWN
jgi:hypothetical protein